MVASLVHPFVSAKTDGGDATQIRASNWNSGHELSGAEQGDVLIASSATALSSVGHGTAGQLFATGGHGALPSWANLSAAVVIAGSNATDEEKAMARASKGVVCSGADDQTTINNVLSSLPSSRNRQAAAILLANFSLSGAMLLDPYTIFDIRQARFTPSQSLTNMLALNGTISAGFIDILGGFFDGSDLTTGAVVRLACNDKNFVNMYGTQILNGGNYGLHISNLMRCFLENVTINDCDGGFYAQALYDAVIRGYNHSNIDTAEGLFLDEYCVSNVFSECYFGGASQNVVLHGCTRQSFHNCKCFDSTALGYVFEDDGSGNGAYDNEIVGGHCQNNSWAGDNTGTNIQFKGHANNNSVVGVHLYEMDHPAKYGVEEKDSADYNLVNGATFKDQGTAPYLLVGAHSKVHGCMGAADA